MMKDHLLRILTLLRMPLAKADETPPTNDETRRFEPRNYRGPIIVRHGVWLDRDGHRVEYKDRG